MPQSAYDPRYARYLATPGYGTFEIHCLELQHSSFSTRYIQNRVPASFFATDELGAEREYRSIGFEISPPDIGGGTMQRLLINIDGMDGDLYIALRAMSPQQRFADPVTIIYRIYFNTITDAPLISPPPRYELHNASPSGSLIRCEARAQGLGDLPAGELYLSERFPVLRVRS